MKTEYVVVSTAVADHLNLASGEDAGFRLGGAGVYAWSGIRLWTPRVRLVTGIGEDFSTLFKAWLQKSGADRAGLLVKDVHTAVSNIRYFSSGERVETPEYGLAHYRRMEATPEEIGRFGADAKGVYIFKDLPEAYWEDVFRLREKQGFRLLWEINADAAKPELRDRVKACAQRCDLFSINRTEAEALFAGASEKAAIAGLQSWGLPMVLYRRGAEGAAVVTPDGVTMVPSVPAPEITDPTGAGNAASAAALYGFCEGMTPYECGLLGSIAAACCIRQYGPPLIGEEEMRRAREVFMELREKQTDA